MGKAETTVDTRSGMPVLIEYAAPYTIYHRGSAGPPPQERRGKGMFVGLIVFALMIILGSAVGIVLAFLGL
ncbi:MAG: hypothetical protein GEV07_11135 [Streptosporangiales bacterium]|nr:hypothetical protein [Streptosporangiales bacterium]